MGKDYELRFFNIDYKKIRAKLKKLGAKLVQKKSLLQWDSFDTPNKKDFARVRNEGNGTVKMTVKTDEKSIYVKSYNVIVNDFEEASKLLSALGCKKRYRIEKLREVWKIKGCSNIYFDAYPGLPWYLEIGCDSEKKLFSLAKKLGLEIKQEAHKNLGANTMYFNEYGIKQNKKNKGDLTFKTAKKIFSKLIKKNKTLFLKTLREQKKILKL